jgi:hypothetical protein
MPLYIYMRTFILFDIPDVVFVMTVVSKLLSGKSDYEQSKWEL